VARIGAQTPVESWAVETGGGGCRSGCSNEHLTGEREGAVRVAPGDTREEPRMVGRHRA
jgi:hypothetical protein